MITHLFVPRCTHHPFHRRYAMVEADEKVADFHHELLQDFKNQPFNYLKAMVKLRITKSILKPRLKRLLIWKLLIKLEETETKKAEFIARKLCKNPVEPTESTFETMLGEWKVFVGFVEF